MYVEEATLWFSGWKELDWLCLGSGSGSLWLIMRTKREGERWNEEADGEGNGEPRSSGYNIAEYKQ